MSCWTLWQRMPPRYQLTMKDSSRPPDDNSTADTTRDVTPRVSSASPRGSQPRVRTPRGGARRVGSAKARRPTGGGEAGGGGPVLTNNEKREGVGGVGEAGGVGEDSPRLLPQPPDAAAPHEAWPQNPVMPPRSSPYIHNMKNTLRLNSARRRVDEGGFTSPRASHAQLANTLSSPRRSAPGTKDKAVSSGAVASSPTARANTAPAFPITSPANTDEYHRLTSPRGQPPDRDATQLEGGLGVANSSGPPRQQRGLSGGRSPRRPSSGYGSPRDSNQRLSISTLTPFGETAGSLRAEGQSPVIHQRASAGGRRQQDCSVGNCQVATLYLDKGRVTFFRKSRPDVTQSVYSALSPYAVTKDDGSYLSHLRKAYLSGVRDLPKVNQKEEPDLEKHVTIRQRLDYDRKVGRILEYYTSNNVDIPQHSHAHPGPHSPRPPGAGTGAGGTGGGAGGAGAGAGAIPGGITIPGGGVIIPSSSSSTSPPPQGGFKTLGLRRKGPRASFHGAGSQFSLFNEDQDPPSSRSPRRPLSARDAREGGGTGGLRAELGGYVRINSQARLHDRHNFYLRTPGGGGGGGGEEEAGGRGGGGEDDCECGMCRLEMEVALMAQLQRDLGVTVDKATAARIREGLELEARRAAMQRSQQAASGLEPGADIRQSSAWAEEGAPPCPTRPNSVSDQHRRQPNPIASNYALDNNNSNNGSNNNNNGSGNDNNSNKKHSSSSSNNRMNTSNNNRNSKGVETTKTNASIPRELKDQGQGHDQGHGHGQEGVSASTQTPVMNKEGTSLTVTLPAIEESGESSSSTLNRDRDRDSSSAETARRTDNGLPQHVPQGSNGGADNTLKQNMDATRNASPGTDGRASNVPQPETDSSTAMASHSQVGTDKINEASEPGTEPSVPSEEIQGTNIATSEEIQGTVLAPSEDNQGTELVPSEEMQGTVLAPSEETQGTEPTTSEENHGTKLAPSAKNQGKELASSEEIQGTELAPSEEIQTTLESESVTSITIEASPDEDNNTLSDQNVLPQTTDLSIQEQDSMQADKELEASDASPGKVGENPQDLYQQTPAQPETRDGDFLSEERSAGQDNTLDTGVTTERPSGPDDIPGTGVTMAAEITTDEEQVEAGTGTPALTPAGEEDATSNQTDTERALANTARVTADEATDLPGGEDEDEAGDSELTISDNEPTVVGTLADATTPRWDEENTGDESTIVRTLADSTTSRRDGESVGDESTRKTHRDELTSNVDYADNAVDAGNTDPSHQKIDTAAVSETEVEKEETVEADEENATTSMDVENTMTAYADSVTENVVGEDTVTANTDGEDNTKANTDGENAETVNTERENAKTVNTEGENAETANTRRGNAETVNTGGGNAVTAQTGGNEEDAVRPDNSAYEENAVTANICAHAKDAETANTGRENTETTKTGEENAVTAKTGEENVVTAQTGGENAVTANTGAHRENAGTATDDGENAETANNDGENAETARGVADKEGQEGAHQHTGPPLIVVSAASDIDLDASDSENEDTSVS